jgi:hypothetical protein
VPTQIITHVAPLIIEREHNTQCVGKRNNLRQGVPARAADGHGADGLAKDLAATCCLLVAHQSHGQLRRVRASRWHARCGGEVLRADLQVPTSPQIQMPMANGMPMRQ